MSSATILLLAWGFCINAIVTGNTYMKQQKYQDFRLTMLLGDLSKFVNPNEKNEALVVGDFGPATQTNMDFKNYKLNFGGINSGWTSYLFQDWNMDMDFVSIESDTTILQKDSALKEKVDSLPLLLDTYYHAIFGKDNFFYIIIKNPQVEKYRIE